MLPRPHTRPWERYPLLIMESARHRGLSKAMAGQIYIFRYVNLYFC